MGEPVDAAAVVAADAASTGAVTAINQASALSTINVRTHIPFSLQLDPPNYTRWRELFFILVGKFGATPHLLGNAPAIPDEVWVTTDLAVKSLLYASLSEELLGIVLTPGASARAIREALEGLFRDNKASRALSLKAEFRNMAQGDLSVLAYSQQLKSYVDALADVGQPVHDNTLVLTLLCGLNDNLRNIAAIIKTRNPLPSFLEARSMLLLEEADLKISKPGSATALIAPTNNFSKPPSTGGNSNPNHRHKGKGKGNNNNCHGSSGGNNFNSDSAPPAPPMGGAESASSP